MNVSNLTLKGGLEHYIVPIGFSDSYIHMI